MNQLANEDIKIGMKIHIYLDEMDVDIAMVIEKTENTITIESISSGYQGLFIYYRQIPRLNLEAGWRDITPCNDPEMPKQLPDSGLKSVIHQIYAQFAEKPQNYTEIKDVRPVIQEDFENQTISRTHRNNLKKHTVV